jgi:citrate synthase
MNTEEKIEIHRGLKGVYFERSATTFIDGKAGELRYRGYSIHDLAQQSTFEETAYLLLNGELPNATQLAAFDAASPTVTRWMHCAPPSLRWPHLIRKRRTIPLKQRVPKAFACHRKFQ